MTDNTAPAMSNIESAIRDLVGSHEAFWATKQMPIERRVEADWLALQEWATMLNGAQEYLGIIIVDPAVIAANKAEAAAALLKSSKEPF